MTTETNQTNQTIFQKYSALEMEMRNLKNAAGFQEMELQAATRELIEARNKIAALELNQVLMQKVRDRQEQMIGRLRTQVEQDKTPDFKPCWKSLRCL